jgi:ribose transport system substrate-binding protein
MFKGYFAIAAALGLAGLMAGCQSGGGTASGPGGKRFKVGVSIPAADHGWTAGVGYWAKEAAKLHPDIDWIIEDAKSPDEQIADLENLKGQGVDALVILCTESAPITPIAKKLKESGILIVNVDRGFTEPVADFFIEGDNKAFGRKSAEYMVVKLGADPKTFTGAKGKIVILRGINSTVDDDRYEAAMKVFAANPGIQILAVQRGEWKREDSDKAMQNILVANPQIDAIWAQDDDMALGAEAALKAAGRDKNIWMLGGAGMKDIVKRVMDGDPMFPADITYPPSMIAVGMQSAAGILRAGKENALKYMPRHVMIDVEMILPENAKDYYFPDSVF